MSKKLVIPVSGGTDSVVLLHQGCANFDEVHAITYRYGQRHSKEIDCAYSQVAELQEKYRDKTITHKEIDISFIKTIASTSALTNSSINVAKIKDVCGHPQHQNYVPFRNMILLSIACSYAESVGADVVYHGAAEIDSAAGYWDGSVEFLDSINSVTSLNRMNKIRIEAPLITLSKRSIILLGKSLNVDFSKTWTCYEGLEKACGECTACSARLHGFIEAGVVDPLPYAKDINWAYHLGKKLT